MIKSGQCKAVQFSGECFLYYNTELLLQLLDFGFLLNKHFYPHFYIPNLQLKT